MAEQSKHSPTPWSVSHDYNIFTQYGQCVATTRIDCGVNTDFALNLANAAHIVHCVNTHDALEAKLEKLVEAASRLIEIDTRHLKSEKRDVCGGVSELMDIDQERKAMCDELSALLAEIKEEG